ncbi:serine/threonine-protein kinase [Streptomyces sp. AP-93]|uniref:serine/threonine-protein kinase n=1 Tax=Streptomyces sp. AP-93 TaxID=2929048 RepID=UPI001FAEC3B7|nr:serine/threonine-protein kinase [Streptomyces sp. AP-93]MCJ0873922.1 serine/threonine-protein kinase [Streptomyces sp. AP-93]
MRSARADYAGFPEYAGQYRLESVLGSGGMGVVHLATSESGLKLAVKIVHPQHAVDPEFRARFRQEVAAARRVSGAFTAPVVDADPDAERPWMATLFIDAPTLSERVRDEVLEARELARLAAGLAEALRDIHRAGVVHRDLKPSNVLMAPDGVRVIDFGISRPADSDLRTETGKLIGTPPFMAPEQFQRPREVGTAADVFALGAVLVYAATGRGPFDSDSHYLVAYQVVHSEPDLTGLPERLVPLVAQCLAKDPAERPSADALIVALRAVAYPTDLDTQAFIPRPRQPVADEEVTHRRERVATPAKAPERRRRTRAAVAAGVGLLLAGGSVGGYLWSASGGDKPAKQAVSPGVPTPQRVLPWTVPLGAYGAACSWQASALYCSGPESAAMRLSPKDGSTLWSVRAAVPGSRPAADSAPLPGSGLVLAVAPGSKSELLRALDPATGTERWKRTLPSGAHALPAGGSVLITAVDGTVTALDSATGAPRWTKKIGGVGSEWWSGPEESGEPAALYVSTPDKDGRATRLSAVDPATGVPRWQVRSPGVLHPVGAAGGGMYLLDSDVGARTDTVVRVDLATRAVGRVRLASPLYEAQATVGPDGIVYAFGASGALAAIGAAKEEWRLETGVAVASRPVFADGRVYLSASDGRLLAVDAGAGRLLGQTKPRMGTGKDTFAASLPAPVVGDGRVYASAPDGSVFAVAAGDPAGW